MLSIPQYSSVASAIQKIKHPHLQYSFDCEGDGDILEG
jgi:hypothetical protein